MSVARSRLFVGTAPTSLWKSAVQFAYYVAGASLTEALLFFVTSLILLIPDWVLTSVDRALRRLLRIFLGGYRTEDGKSRLVSLLGYFDNKSFVAPPHLSKSLPAFPTAKLHSFENVQVFQSLISVSYEDWEVVRDVIKKWDVHESRAQFVAGYHVASFTPPSTNSDGSRSTAAGNSIKVDVDIFVARVNNAAVVVFRGTEPLMLQDWVTNYDIYGDEGIGGGGFRVHPGYRTALGLNKDLLPVNQAKTEATRTDSDGRAKTSVINTIFELLLEDLAALQGDGVSKTFVIGHSQGGGFATIFTAAVNLRSAFGPKLKVAGLYTIGQPRCGDSTFGQKLEASLGHRGDKITYLRIVNVNDIVPQMPPAGPHDLGDSAYQHCGQLVFISAFGCVYRQFEQPRITFALAVLVSISSALQVTWLYLHSRLLRFTAPDKLRSKLHPGPVFVLLKWIALLFFPHGLVQHAVPNYSLAVMNSKPEVWELQGSAKSLSAEVKEAVNSLPAFRSAKQQAQAAFRQLPSWRQARGKRR